MKTSDSKQQLLTSLKNGKIGIFRSQTSLSKLKMLLKDRVEIEDTDRGSVWLGDQIEVYFEDDLMTRARFKLHVRHKSGSWLKVINLSWLDYLTELSFGEVRTILEEGGAEFKSIEYDNGDLAILSSTPHAQLMMFFGKDGEIDQAHLEFDFRYRLFNDVKELIGYPR